jgi:FixJ family two-component response regulator
MGVVMAAVSLGSWFVEVVDADPIERARLVEAVTALGVMVHSHAALEDEPFRRANPQLGCLLVSAEDWTTAPRRLEALLSELRAGIPGVMIGRALSLACVVQMLKAGAVDVLHKPVEPAAVQQAVQEGLLRATEARERARRFSELRTRLDRLTPREREVTSLLVRGLLNKQVGSELGIAERTVKGYRAQVFRKVGVCCVAELVRIATVLELEQAAAPPAGFPCPDRASSASRRAHRALGAR